MNKTISDFTREKILEELLRLPEGHQDLFKRMYRKDATLREVISSLPSEKLDWALSQVENSRVKLDRKLAELDVDKS